MGHISKTPISRSAYELSIWNNSSAGGRYIVPADLTFVPSISCGWLQQSWAINTPQQKVAIAALSYFSIVLIIPGIRSGSDTTYQYW